MLAPLATSIASPLAERAAWDGDPVGAVVDPGYVFVFLADGRQLCTSTGDTVQVGAEYANS